MLSQIERLVIYIDGVKLNEPDCIVQLIFDIRWIEKPFLRDQK